MNLLFIHDHPFYKENESVYSGGAFPHYVWNNYLKKFKELTVFGRLSHNKNQKIVLAKNETQNISFKLTNYYGSVFSLFNNFNKLRNELSYEIEKVDVVLVRLPSVLGFISAFIAKKHNKKIIVEQVGNAKEALSAHGSFIGKIASPVFEFVNKYIVRNADYVIYVTKKKLQISYPTKCASESISDVVIHKVLSKEELRLERYTSRVIKIGLIGGFDAKYKGQDVLLKAISILSAEIKSHIELYFVGKGNNSWLLGIADKLGLTGTIKFIGPKESGKEIFDFLETLSLYIQPSYTEGMPRALLEAMSVGTPVLGSYVGGIPDVINKEFLHKPGDYITLSNQIRDLYLDRKKLEKEALRSLETASAFQIDKLDLKREVFYNHILNDLKNDKT